MITEGQLFELMARRGRLEAERDEAAEITFDPELLETAPGTQPDVKDLVQGQQRLFLARKDSTAREIEQLEKRRVQIEEQIRGIQAQQKSM